MHIIALENQPSSQRGGQELSLFDVCRGLAARGHQVSLLYRSPGDLLTQYQQFCQQTVPVRQYRLEMKQPLQSSWQLASDIRQVSVGPDSVVYANQYHDSFLGLLLAGWHRLPLVCHLRLPPPPALGWQWRWGMASARRLIAVSQQTRQAWIECGMRPERIACVYNGIDPQRFSPAPAGWVEARSRFSLPADRSLITYVGRLDRPKGVETLIRGFGLALEAGLAGHLAIAGKPHNQRPTYLDELKGLVQALALGEQVSFLGHVAAPEQLYQASDLLVLPSEWPEPFGRTLIEAMACGTPALGSRTGGIPEVLSGPLAAGLFEPANAAALAQRLVQFGRWREQDPGLGQRCREQAIARFDLSQTLSGVEQALLAALRA